MYLPHCVAGVPHRLQRFFVDVRCFYTVYLTLEGHDLPVCLLESMLELLFSSEGGFSGYMYSR